MSVVHLFGARKRIEEETTSPKQESQNDNTTGEVVELIINQKIAHGVAPRTIYRQMEALLTTNGVDLSCPKITADYKLVTYLVQGMLDRTEGKDLRSSQQCLMLDTLRHALAYEEPVNTRESDELFGDLLGRLD